MVELRTGRIATRSSIAPMGTNPSSRLQRGEARRCPRAQVRAQTKGPRVRAGRGALAHRGPRAVIPFPAIVRALTKSGGSSRLGQSARIRQASDEVAKDISCARTSLRAVSASRSVAGQEPPATCTVLPPLLRLCSAAFARVRAAIPSSYPGLIGLPLSIAETNASTSRSYA
jgi:hypothetical protein